MKKSIATAMKKAGKKGEYAKHLRKFGKKLSNKCIRKIKEC